MKIVKPFLLGICVTAFMSFDLPAGWNKAGSSADSYDMGIDKGAGQDGKNCATIKSLVADIKGFGSLMQTVLPGSFLIKRIRMSGYMKTKDVADWAGFWVSV